jgi:hypothetical protein
MMSIRKTLLAVAATVSLLASIQPTTVSAQTSGVGGDGYTRLLWRGTNGSISLWELDPNLNFVTYHEYGPFALWWPIALITAHNNYTYILWRYYDGSISLWLVDPNLNYVTDHIYGPYPGWVAKDLSVDTNGSTNGLRVIWRYYDGSVNVWWVDQNLNFVKNDIYGPYFGYYPGSSE